MSNTTETITARLREALSRRSAEDRARIEAKLEHAHHQVLQAVQGVPGSRGSEIAEFSRAHGLLQRGRDLLADVEDAIGGTPDPQGGIYRDGTYELLDVGWLEALLTWVENAGERAPFGTRPATIEIPNDIDVAVLGDWGTGDFGTPQAPSGSTLIRQYVSQTLRPAITIHLGDVYFTGTEDNERTKFLDIFPAGRTGSYTLNSNHEMYPGARGYFDVALASSTFGGQQGTSYFCLHNDDWALVGLDTAYYADYWDMYMAGTLRDPSGGSVQLDFLREVASSGRQIILLSHHNPVSLPGEPTALLAQVDEALAGTPSGAKPVIWYYGHLHNGAVYEDVVSPGGVTIRPRLSGHAAVPYTVATDLTKSKKVRWLERAYVSGHHGPVRNGFSTLDLSGSKLRERMLDQTGHVSWEESSVAKSS
ncbi:MAG: metallophosphoesterase [Deltaproteobacteria bacterium]|nr:metallophosphoesterase [Deltaproteobacteria bacterium]